MLAGLFVCVVWKEEGIMRIYRREASEIIVGIIRRKSPLQTL